MLGLQATTTGPNLFLVLKFLVEMTSHYVAQPDLQLLASSNYLALAFQSAGITDVSYHAWPRYFIYVKLYYVCPRVKEFYLVTDIK